jgi:hypothetical protein
MKEAEWCACEDAFSMLHARREKLNNRKLRLFAVACCRRVWDRLTTERQKKAVELAERFADGEITREQFKRSRRAALVAESGGLAADAVNYALHNDAFNAARFAAGNAAPLAVEERVTLGGVGSVLRYSGAAEQLERRVQAALLRCIAGARYRLPKVKPVWLTSDVLALARGIYAERAFDRMPILADALQDAGCDSAPILDHCREANPVHVRGCWVVDLVLGKA